ncbi:MAG: tetratricopeptide repeat protein [Candidatus Eisenbacteria sp.]|nr:tetratricopeptide repeat protein [Candidatus Eisenbacteria bacterium]
MMTYLIIALLGLVLGTILLLPFFGARGRRGLKSMLTRYQTITDALLAGDLARAGRELTEIIRGDTDDIGAYLKLARILRRQGELERAVAVHRSLTARQIGDRSLRCEVLHGLIGDLIELHRVDEARPWAEELRRLERRDPLLSRVEAHLALEAGDWDAARRALAVLRRGGGRSGMGEAARVGTYMAELQAAAGDLPGARKTLEGVLGAAPGFTPAALRLGDLWQQEENFERGAGIWTDQLRRQPQAAPALVPRLEKAYFELGRFGDLERVFEEVIAAAGSEAIAVRLALVRIAVRKGDAERALEMVEELQQQHPDDYEAQRWQLYLMLETGQGEEARRMLKASLEDARGAAEQRRCPGCGQELEAAAVRCPACRRWLDPAHPVAAGK